MAEDFVNRRLAAILVGDVAHYSQLMGVDEEGTLRQLKAHRKELIDPKIVEHRGRIVKTTGDGMLVEFVSVVDAVRCAVDIQRGMAERNAEVPRESRIEFRIGINVGDIISDDNDIYGDGVNVAARLEALALPGGICVSAKIHEEVHRKLALAFEDLGEHALKNIAASVRVYRIVGGAKAGAATPAAAAKQQEAAHHAKPSIIVLPFVNMSGIAEQEFFADGLTEDILTDLSRFRELFVISRNTSFKFKGQAVDVKKVARELGVQYVVEGSVRRAGNRVRVTVQLIDAESDRHIWAERYDRDLEDIFAIQDEVTSAIVATLPGRLEAAARDRAERKPTGNMPAYECVLEAKVLHHRSKREDNDKAQILIGRAIKLDPKYAHAHAWKACILGQAWTYEWCADAEATKQLIERELEIALAIDENDSDVQRVLAALRLTQRNHDASLFHQQRALSLNPNDDLIVVQQGEILTWIGEPENGIPWLQKAMRLNPFHPPRFWNHLGRAYFVARRYAEAVEAFKRIAAPDQFLHAYLAACYAQLGDTAAAGNHVKEVLNRNPGFSWGNTLMPMLHYKREIDLFHHRDSIRKARFPL